MLYSQADQQNIANAVKKAKKLKPKVKVLGYARFSVAGSGKEADSYLVEFSKVAGELAWSCTCKGHARNQVCYHSVSCSALFKQQVAARTGFPTYSYSLETYESKPCQAAGDLPEQSISLSECVTQVSCNRCEAYFEPQEWEIDAVSAGDGSYLCGSCTHRQLDKHRAEAIYLVTIYQAVGGPSYATL